MPGESSNSSRMKTATNVSKKETSSYPYLDPSARVQSITAYHPGDKKPTRADIHACVRRYLGAQEMFDFKFMTPNKEAVVALYYVVLKGYLPQLNSIEYLRFGFDKLSCKEELSLTILFKALIMDRDCKVVTFLSAYESGKLIALIQSVFQCHEQHSQSYMWFLQHRWLFEGMRAPSTSYGARESDCEY